MSGHSKWATIHRQKEVKDAKRGQIFTKLAQAITIAVRQGGGVTDPNSNFRLRLVIEKARALNMPKENIQRAIQRAAGEGAAEAWEDVVYEGYAPFGVAVIAEASTDNKQRTAQEVKNVFEKNGGRLGTSGTVDFLFERKGLITANKTDSNEELMLKIMDVEGVEDVEEAEDVIEVYTMPENLDKVRRSLEESGMTINSFELTRKPKTTTLIDDKEKAQKILNFLEKLEDLNDVQKVYANFDIPEELVEIPS